MKFELTRYHRDTPEAELLADLKRVADELGIDTLTKKQYAERGKFGAGTMRVRFGEWYAALELAGLKTPRKSYRITDEQFFENLRQVWLKLGRQPTFVEMEQPLSKFSGTSYISRFGRWSLALEAFVAHANNEPFPAAKTAENETPRTRGRGGRKNRYIGGTLRLQVLKRDNFKCNYCGRSPATDPGVILHIDHIKALANGGETKLSNLQALCSVCNNAKRDSSMFEPRIPNS
jgi:hypothetical protein